jgi:multidrug efflux system membrane fusion protein
MSDFSRMTLTALGVAVLFTGCRKEESAAPPPQQIPEVGVHRVAPESVVITAEQPGRLEAYRQAEIRARVPGIVMARPYEEGQEVKAGTVLFQIDPAPFKAALDAAAAAVAEAEATHTLAVDKKERYENLVSSKAISVRDLNEANAEEKQARSRISSAKAELELAKLRLEYATVTSPIDGRARKAQVTEGALVGEGSATLLTTVEQIDPIYVNFSQPVADVMALQRSVAEGKLEGLKEGEMKVELVFADGTVHETPGKLLFSDLAVDPSTDSVAMRALFPNPDRRLLPGMYVRIRMDRAVFKEAILLPRVAVLRSGNVAQVMSVNENDEVVPIEVKADTMHGDQWLVTSGLKGGERIIVENPGFMFPGSKVKPIDQP